MSLVRSVEPSAATYRNPKLYSLKGGNDTAGLSSPIFGSSKRKSIYMADSCSSESYEKYFLDSPAEEPTYPSSSGISDTHSLDTSDFNDDPMTLKLRELERALLDDNDVFEDDDLCGAGMEIDGEWSDPIRKDLLHDSPKESSTSIRKDLLHDSPKESSTSSDSYVSSISSSKEVSNLHLSPRTPQQLLIDCASALSEGNIEEASRMINDLRQMVSIQGEPSERIAAYMVEGLVARMAASGKFLYKALKCKEPPSTDRLAAMQILFEICPCFKFGFMSANGAIIEAFRDEKRVHIVDFDISQGNQYITLIQTLANQPGKPPHVRLTGIDDPESIQRPVGGLEMVGLRLEKLAEILGVPFEFQAVPTQSSTVTPSMLDCRAGEALIVNFAFQLHHMPDESVSTINQRDQLLRMVKSLNPKLVTVVEQDVNTNTSPFLQRFIEAYNYYSTVFESLDATLPRDSQDRMNVEKQCLARDIVNIVACEGEERIERYEVAGKWRARMMMAGFKSCPVSSNVIDTVQKVINQYSNRYTLKEEFGTIHFGWEEKSLIVSSVWR